MNQQNDIKESFQDRSNSKYLEETPIFASMMELIKFRILTIAGGQQLVQVNNRDLS